MQLAAKQSLSSQGEARILSRQGCRRGRIFSTCIIDSKARLPLTFAFAFAMPGGREVAAAGVGAWGAGVRNGRGARVRNEGVGDGRWQRVRSEEWAWNEGAGEVSVS